MAQLFTVESVYDISVHREFSLGYLHANRLRIILYPVYILFVPYLVVMNYNSIFQYVVLFLATFFWVEAIIYSNKKGNIQYKRLLAANNGQMPLQVFQFCEDYIQYHNPNTNASVTYSYDQFRRLIETKNLFILVMDYRLCLVIEKKKLLGGTLQDFSAFLLGKCPKIKQKRTRKTTLGKWCYRFFLIIMLVCGILALFNIFDLPLIDQLSGKLHNNMSYAEMCDELSTLGITISPQTISEMEAMDAEYFSKYGCEYYDDNPSECKIEDLIYWEAAGSYNSENQIWTPSASGIYWFDTEVMHADSIYTDFLTGLSAMHEDLNFSNIREDYSRVDIEDGIGIVVYSFDWKGQHFELEANYYYDWFDTSTLFTLAPIVEENANSNRLYYCFDDGQGIWLYYGNTNHAKQLSRMSGLKFRSASN